MSGNFSTFNVPVGTKELIKEYMERHNYPSMSQAVTAIVKEVVTREKYLTFVVKLVLLASEKKKKSIRKLTLEDVFDTLKEICLNEKEIITEEDKLIKKLTEYLKE